MSSQEDLSLDLKDLEKFFQENSNEFVGTAGDCDNCPIANYFYSVKNLSVLVYDDEIGLEWDPSCYRKLSSQEQDFVRRVDKEYEKCDLRGHEATAILQTILYE